MKSDFEIWEKQNKNGGLYEQFFVQVLNEWKE